MRARLAIALAEAHRRMARAGRSLARRPFAALLLCLALAGAISLLLGGDDNWDLHNYHLYNAFAWLGGRHGNDLNAVGLQSWFPPLLDVPYYLLATGPTGRLPALVAFLAGAPFGLLLWLVFQLARALPGQGGGRAALLATALGGTGSIVASEIGTTFGDIPVAVLVLAGLLALVRARGAGQWAVPALRACAVAGVCAGLAVALKPTAIVFVPGLVLGVLLTGSGWRGRMAEVPATGLGLALGFAAGYLPWVAVPWGLFGNPVFPFLDPLFAPGSPSSAPPPDLRFLPRDWFQAVTYPFWWTRGVPFRASELGVRDWHFAVAQVAVLALAAVRLRGRAADPRLVLLLVFAAASYVGWIATFAILRYIVALEVLTGVLALAALGAVGFTPRRRLDAGLALLVFFLATTGWPGWGRVSPWTGATFAIDAPVQPPGTTVVVASKPVGFVIPFIPGQDLRFVGLVDLVPGSRLEAMVHARIRAAPHAALLASRDVLEALPQLAALGWAIDRAACAALAERRARWSRIVLCPLHRSP